MAFGFSFLDDEASEKESIDDVLNELSVKCDSCRLAQHHPFNRGMVTRGNPYAKIAIVGGAPGDSETEKGVPLVGMAGKEFEKWMSFVGIDTRNDVLITNVVQCQPPKKEINGKRKTREPEKDEINACFGPRTLRVLRAMPNLEAVILLGWVSGRAFLGTSNEENIPKVKTHEGQWFESSLLPGIGIFCISHPEDVVFLESPEKRMVIQKFLTYFKREMFELNKIKPLAEAAKARREELGLGIF